MRKQQISDLDIAAATREYADRIVMLITDWIDEGVHGEIHAAIQDIAALIVQSLDTYSSPDEPEFQRRAAYLVGVQVGLRLRGAAR